MSNEMDEMELLASVNPEPDVTGNPWADEVLVVEPDPLRRRRRRVIWIGGISVVAAAALVAGVLLLGGGDPVRRVEIDPAGTTTPMRPASLPEIPWNDPIELRFDPGPSLDEIVVPYPGTLLFKLPTALQGGEVSFCAGFEGPADPKAPLLPDTYRCSGDTNAAAGYLGAEGPVIASVFDEEIRVLYRNSESSPYSVIGSLAVERSPGADQAPSLASQLGHLSSLEPQLSDRSYPVMTRNDHVVALTGAGFDPGEQVTIARCLGVGYAPIDYRDCESATATLADETGDIEVDVDVAAAALENGVVEIFAFQGDRLTHTIGFMRSGPSLLLLPSDDTDTNVAVRVVGLLPGEVGRIEVCPWAGFECSVDPVRSYTVVGTGSDDLTVNVAARGFGSMGLWLYVDDVLAPVGGIPVPRIPGSAAQLPPGTLAVSPASVPGPDHYTFTVTGSGWTAKGPIFVWACATEIVEQTARGFPTECGTGDTETPAPRARVTPVNGAFTVERPYAPGQDFFIIASDGAQTQVATFRVKFGEP